MANLRGFIGTTDTRIEVDNTSDLPVNGGVVQVESEKIVYTRATDTALLGCTRGALSTSAAAHADKKPVTNLSDSIFNSGVLDLNDAGAPTDGITGIGLSKIGDRYTNTTTGDVFVNTGTIGAPVWTMFDTGAGGITQLHGDVAAGPGTGNQAATLATVNSNVGSFTNASVTVNDKGLVTAASNGTAPVTSVTGTVNDISSSGGTTPVLDLINTAVTPNSYTNANITVDEKGRITAASNGSSAAPGGSTGNVQLNDGAGNFTGSNVFTFDGNSLALDSASSGNSIILAPTSGNAHIELNPVSGVPYQLWHDVANVKIGAIELESNTFIIQTNDFPVSVNDLNNDGAGEASAVLSLHSTSRGFLPPVMSTTTKNGISSPAEGLVVYDITLHKLSVFTGTVWETVTSA